MTASDALLPREVWTTIVDGGGVDLYDCYALGRTLGLVDRALAQTMAAYHASLYSYAQTYEQVMSLTYRPSWYMWCGGHLPLSVCVRIHASFLLSGAVRWGHVANMQALLARGCRATGADLACAIYSKNLGMIDALLAHIDCVSHMEVHAAITSVPLTLFMQLRSRWPLAEPPVLFMGACRQGQVEIAKSLFHTESAAVHEVGDAVWYEYRVAAARSGNVELMRWLMVVGPTFAGCKQACLQAAIVTPRPSLAMIQFLMDECGAECADALYLMLLCGVNLAMTRWVLARGPRPTQPVVSPLRWLGTGHDLAVLETELMPHATTDPTIDCDLDCFDPGLYRCEHDPRACAWLLARAVPSPVLFQAAVTRGFLRVLGALHAHQWPAPTPIKLMRVYGDRDRVMAWLHGHSYMAERPNPPPPPPPLEEDCWDSASDSDD